MQRKKEKNLNKYDRAMKEYEIESRANRIAIEFVMGEKLLSRWEFITNYCDYIEKAKDEICLDNFDMEKVLLRSINILKEKYNILILSICPLEFIHLSGINL